MQQNYLKATTSFCQAVGCLAKLNRCHNRVPCPLRSSPYVDTFSDNSPTPFSSRLPRVVHQLRVKCHSLSSFYTSPQPSFSDPSFPNMPLTHYVWVYQLVGRPTSSQFAAEVEGSLIASRAILYVCNQGSAVSYKVIRSIYHDEKLLRSECQLGLVVDYFLTVHASHASPSPPCLHSLRRS